ncbi:MAG: geranylgeranyl reductase family protein [Proteobacteria bacterium]|nr:geranylgeranyl reductase family protein [Pseudomonadota bacterium]
MYDVIVVGMGPAGSMAAYDLANKGLKVLALDKERFPRYKSCGGCVSVKVDPIVDFDFSDLIEDTVSGISFTYKSKRRIDVDSKRPIAYNVSRDRFDAFLVDKAIEAGTELIDGTRVVSCVDNGDHVEVSTKSDKYKARYLIGADGANGVIGREALKIAYKHNHLSITAEIPASQKEIERLKGRCLVDFGSVPYGYAWIFPKAETLSVGIAGYSSKVKGRIKEHYSEFVESHPVLRGLPRPATKGWFIPVYHGDDQTLFEGRMLVVGDAAHLVDPFLGEGIYYAMRSGQIAAGSIEHALNNETKDLAHYRDHIAEEFYSDFKANGSLVGLIYRCPRMWYRLVETQPRVMEKYYNVLRGEISCEEFYGEIKKKLLKKSWRALSGLIRPKSSKEPAYD